MYPRGSEWRRWDLHIHTPGTLFEDGFRGDWEEYLAAIERTESICALGITDYMSIQNYSSVRQHKASGRLANIQLLIPNIEFRVTPETERGSGVNIHLLLSPEDPDHEMKINEALTRLTYEYEHSPFPCTHQGMMALGRALDSSIRDDRTALIKGASQFKCEFTKFREWYRHESWLRSNSVVAVSGGNDGLSGIDQRAGFAATREEITRFAQIIFSGRQGEREFWLGSGGDEQKTRMLKLGGPKPCVHGSDAHEMGRLLKPDLDRYCWIKADPTFEGLRQIIFEPEERIHIGPTPPCLYDETRIIEKVSISSPSKWFDELSIPINNGLVAIIGQKGSGKSALAELIAYACGERPNEERDSFLSRAREHLDGTKIVLHWGRDSKTSVTLFDDGPRSSEVRYLSQRFVERLCSDDLKGHDLIREVEAIIFDHLDPSDTLNASDFSELRTLKTRTGVEERRRIQANLQKLFREDEALRQRISSLVEKKSRLGVLKKESEGLLSQLPEPKNDEETALGEALKEANTKLAQLQEESASDKQRLGIIENLRTDVETFRLEMDEFFEAASHSADILGFTIEEKEAFRPTFGADPNELLERRIQGILKAISDRDGTSDPPPSGTIKKYQMDLQVLRQRASSNKALHDRVEVIQKRVTGIATESKRIQEEIRVIEETDRPRIQVIPTERMEEYLKYFSSLSREQSLLEDLYAPVREKLDSGNEQEQHLDFFIRWQVDIDQWIDRGASLFDLRKTIPHGSIDELKQHARSILEPAWKSGSLDSIRNAMAEFLGPFVELEKTKGSYLRSAVTRTALLEWLFSVEHIRLNYGLRYDGTELEKLSPGVKGIVLLILYLGVGDDDTRPLIIDQPEENLDNESTYNLLSKYFRSAKQRRQIILITHNPNLVVNTDAEQVIIASCERRGGNELKFKYVSGSLENALPRDPGIRGHVCRILEGGAEAFRGRERRYESP